MPWLRDAIVHVSTTLLLIFFRITYVTHYPGTWRGKWGSWCALCNRSPSVSGTASSELADVHCNVDRAIPRLGGIVQCRATRTGWDGGGGGIHVPPPRATHTHRCTKHDDHEPMPHAFTLSSASDSTLEEAGGHARKSSEQTSAKSASEGELCGVSEDELRPDVSATRWRKMSLCQERIGEGLGGQVVASGRGRDAGSDVGAFSAHHQHWSRALTRHQKVLSGEGEWRRLRRLAQLCRIDNEVVVARHGRFVCAEQITAPVCRCLCHTPPPLPLAQARPKFQKPTLPRDHRASTRLCLCMDMKGRMMCTATLAMAPNHNKSNHNDPHFKAQCSDRQ